MRPPCRKGRRRGSIGGYPFFFALGGERLGVLTTTEKRYIDICVAQIASADTNEAIAQRFGVARTCVDRALRWGRERGLYTLDTNEKLRVHLQELGTVLRRLERAFLAMDRRYRKLLRNGRDRATTESPTSPPFRSVRHGPKDATARGSIRLMVQLAERILGYRTRIMELEGIYKQVLNIQHGGTIAVRAEPDLSRLDDDKLNQLEQLTRLTIASNN